MKRALFIAVVSLGGCVVGTLQLDAGLLCDDSHPCLDAVFSACVEGACVAPTGTTSGSTAGVATSTSSGATAASTTSGTATSSTGTGASSGGSSSGTSCPSQCFSATEVTVCDGGTASPLACKAGDAGVCGADNTCVYPCSVNGCATGQVCDVATQLCVATNSCTSSCAGDGLCVSGICLPRSSNTPGACGFAPDAGSVPLTLQGDVSCFPGSTEDSLLGQGQVFVLSSGRLFADSGITADSVFWTYSISPIPEGTYTLGVALPASSGRPAATTYYPDVVLTGDSVSTTFALPTTVCPGASPGLPQQNAVAGHLALVGRLVDCQNSSAYVSGAYVGLSTVASISYEGSGQSFSTSNPGTDSSAGANFFAADVPYAPLDFVVAAGSNDGEVLYGGTFTPPPYDDGGPQLYLSLDTPNGA